MHVDSRSHLRSTLNRHAHEVAAYIAFFSIGRIEFRVQVENFEVELCGTDGIIARPL